MAKTRDYMDYLDNQIGIAPANSQEEYQAAETIVEVMKDHGIEPTVQEFDTHWLGELTPSVMGLMLFIGVLLTGLSGGAVRVVGFVVALISVVLLVLNHAGNNVLANVGPVQRSQNVIGVHRAASEKAIKGARPIVIVAHYDTPRENVLYGGTFARYQSTLYKAAYPCVAIAGAVALTQVLVFLPTLVRVVLWVVGLVACVPVVVIAVATIVERFAGCTAGSNDNKASVAAMLSVLNSVCPAEDRVDAAAEGKPYARRASEDQKPETMMVPEKPIGVRHGKEVIESLGMLPSTCEIVYEEPKLVSVPVEQSSQNPAEAASEKGEAEDNAGEAVPRDGEPDEFPGAEEEVSYQETTPSEQVDADTVTQDDDEYYSDNTEGVDTSGQEYDGDTQQHATADTSSDQESADDTLRREPTDGRKKKVPTEKPTVGQRTKNWFNKLKSRFSHKDDEPIQIARGKAAEPTEAENDYSQYETTYDGEDEVDQWSTRGTEQLKPLRSEEIHRVRTAARPDVSEDDESDVSEEQSLGDIYGQFTHEDGQQPQDAAAPVENGDDADANGEDDVAEAEAIDHDEGDGTTQPEGSPDAATIDGDDYDDEPQWDVSTDDQDTDDAQGIPEPIRVDAIQPERNTGVKAQKDDGNVVGDSSSAQGATSKDTLDDGQNGDSVPEDGRRHQEDDQLSWDQPSVEDEDYYEEYPEGDVDPDAYAEEDSYYADDESGSYPYPDDTQDNVYEEGEASEGGFHRFVDRVKGLFSKKDVRSGERQPDVYSDGPDDDDTEYEGDDHPETYAYGSDESNAPRNSEQMAEEEVRFEEVRSEEYLPSDQDAMYDDVDDDYDFAPADTDDDGNQEDRRDVAVTSRSVRLQYDDSDSDEQGDILPQDTTGLDALLDDDYAESAGTSPRTRPQPIDDPSWGKSTYEPPVSRASIARRAALLDLPNPSAEPVDPLAEDSDDYDGGQSNAEAVTHDDLDDTAASEATDAGQNQTHWKGGAAVRSDLRSDGEIEDGGFETPEDAVGIDGIEQMHDEQADAADPTHAPDEGEMQDAILDLGDDLLQTHDVWFVAVGASSVGHAGIRSFLANFRKDIRGAFMVNLDSIGAGVPVVLTREGLNNGRRADRRSLRLFEETAKDLHLDVQHIDYGWRDTDATAAMRARVRSFTIMGMDENGLPALSHTMNDVPMNVDPKQVAAIARTLCEFIRRS